MFFITVAFILQTCLLLPFASLWLVWIVSLVALVLIVVYVLLGSEKDGGSHIARGLPDIE
jgi:hypothetical protein